MLEEMLGEQRYEKVLRGSKNPKIVRLIETIAILRFLLFPVSAIFLLATLVLSILMFGLNFLASVTAFIYKVSIDARWLSLGWFGLTTKELAEEYTLAGGTVSGDGEILQ